jgi:hypothetical protein
MKEQVEQGRNLLCFKVMNRFKMVDTFDAYYITNY